jgi:hypothetical protein
MAMLRAKAISVTLRSQPNERLAGAYNSNRTQQC